MIMQQDIVARVETMLLARGMDPATVSWSDDVRVVDFGSGPRIGQWDAARLGPQPSAADLAAVDPAARCLARARQRAEAEVERQAEAARRLWLTPGSGQALEYQRTADEARAARAALAAGTALAAAEYPHLQAEVDAGGAASLEDAAALVEAAEAAWTAASAEIKRVRRHAKLEIAAAGDPAVVADIMAGLAWPTPTP